MWLGMDAGASALKWCAVDEANVIHEGKLSPLTGHLFDEVARDRALHALKAVAEQIGTPITAVVLGVPGLSDKAVLEKLLSQAFGTSNIQVITDSELAYHANLLPGEGTVIYAGTGSVLIHVTEDDHVIQVGGRGYLLGDEGGGYWIGCEALRHVVKHFDAGTDPQSDPFASAVLRETGATTWRELIPFVYGGQRDEIAALTKVVRQFCDKANTDALDIIDRAASELARQYKILAARISPSAAKLVLAGGAFNSSPEMKLRLEQYVGVTAIDGAANAAHGAARRARATFPSK